MRVDYDEIIRSAYTGILSPDGWGPFLEHLRRLTNAEQASLMVHDLLLDRTTISEIANPDASLISDYENQFSGIDPVRPAVAAMSLGTTLVDVFHLGRRLVEHGEFHQQFLRAHGLKSILCAKACHDSRHLAGLAMQGGVERAYFGPDDVALLQPVMPHLIAATRLRLKVDQLARAARVGQVLLDGLAWPVMLFDGCQRLLYANLAAERWLCRTPGGNAAALQLARSLARSRKTVPAATEVPGDSGQRRYLLGFIVPHHHPLHAGISAPLSLVIVRGHVETLEQARTMFAELFALTPSELRLVHSLQTHDQLTSAAQALNISHGTARAHLKAAFAKCGCRSQAALRTLWADVTGGFVDVTARTQGLTGHS